MTTRIALLAAPALALGLLVYPAAAAPFDGMWQVTVITQSGDCSQYAYPLRVSDGRITYAGNANANASGRVTADGRVSGSVSAGGRTIVASGRVSGARGAGTWNGAGCSGRWQAEKR